MITIYFICHQVNKSRDATSQLRASGLSMLYYALIIETSISGWRVQARLVKGQQSQKRDQYLLEVNVPVNTGKMAAVALKEVDSNDVPDVSNLNSG